MSIVIIPLPVGHQQSGPKPESGTASLFIPYGKCLHYGMIFLLSLMPYGQLVTLLLGKAQVSQAEQSQRKYTIGMKKSWRKFRQGFLKINMM